MKFKELREKFNQSVPGGKKLKDFEVFLDSKDIDKALKILSTQFKKDKISFNPKMKNLKVAPSGKDVIINAIDEGDRHRLIVMGSERSKNFGSLDMTAVFTEIQKLPSAQFKSMWAEGNLEEKLSPKEMKKRLEMIRKAVEKLNAKKDAQAKKDALAAIKALGD